MVHKLDFSFPVCKKGSEEKTQSRDTVPGPLHRNTQHSFSWYLMLGRISSKNCLRVTSYTSLIRSYGGGCVQPPLWRLQHYHLFPLNFYFGFICFIVCLCFACTFVWASHAIPGVCGGQERSLDFLEL